MKDPEELWMRAWQMLRRGTVDKHHGFQTGTFTTLHSTAGDNESMTLYPRSRTIVLRTADYPAATLTAYTDLRSTKAEDLRRVSPASAWCFWDRKHSLQFTAQGPTEVISGPEATRIFRSLPKHSRKAYATLAPPGEPLTEGTDGLPDDWADRATQDTTYAAEHFCILTTTLLYADVLLLARDGHRRIRARRGAPGENWDLTWVVP